MRKVYKYWKFLNGIGKLSLVPIEEECDFVSFFIFFNLMEKDEVRWHGRVGPGIRRFYVFDKLAVELEDWVDERARDK